MGSNFSKIRAHFEPLDTATCKRLLELFLKLSYVTTGKAFWANGQQFFKIFCCVPHIKIKSLIEKSSKIRAHVPILM